MASISDEDMATLQKLSNDYEPEVEGPLVGQRQSSHAITAQYAQADPVYVRKTAALPHTYSHYRTVRGDGNCGWRAIMFGYFEALLRLGDPMKILAEESRLKSLNNLLNAVGFQEVLYEDFVEETISLLRQTATSIPCQDNGAGLLHSFNDAGMSNAIITHFRLITSAWMKTHADTYQPFLPDKSVDEYCATSIEPYQVEIEHLGMNALIEAVINPAGMAVEILYLDRSEGNEVNSHRFELLGPDGQALHPHAPTIRLLYRPGHYDLLYKIEDIADMMAPVQVSQMPMPAVYSMSNYSGFEATPSYSHTDTAPGFAILNLSPNVQMADFPSLTGFSPTYDLPASFIDDLSPSPISPALETLPSPPMSIPSATSMTRAQECSFRKSKYEVEPEYRRPVVHQAPCETPAMKNNGASPAHFRSEDFQPEICDPGSEYRVRGKR